SDEMFPSVTDNVARSRLQQHHLHQQQQSTRDPPLLRRASLSSSSSASPSMIVAGGVDLWKIRTSRGVHGTPAAHVVPQTRQQVPAMQKLAESAKFFKRKCSC